MTTRELEGLAGKTLPSKLVFVLVGDRLFNRESDGSWYEYESGATARTEGKDAPSGASTVSSTVGTGATIGTPEPGRLADSTRTAVAPDWSSQARS